MAGSLRTVGRIRALDRRMAAVHEAGHAAIAMHVGVDVWSVHIYPNDTNDICNEKTYRGQATFEPPSDPNHWRMISVAGMVAERVWEARGPAFVCWPDNLSDSDCMSPTDWEGTGCEPGEPDDALIAAVDAVEDLLVWDLWPKLVALSRKLIEADSRRTPEATLDVSSMLGHRVVREVAFDIPERLAA